MKEILGKWIQRKDQPYAGLWFEFLEDGTFMGEYATMAIFSSGTYTVSGNHIDMNQTSHSFGMIGKFAGLFEIEDNVMKLAIAKGAGQPRPETLEQARIYIKQPE
ncbi:MAG: hypothetical protein J7K85_06690 [Anaerolineaceae bacterium]|nr:hypothetical protein [Anaerolineaceae bacterium]